MMLEEMDVRKAMGPERNVHNNLAREVHNIIKNLSM